MQYFVVYCKLPNWFVVHKSVRELHFEPANIGFRISTLSQRIRMASAGADDDCKAADVYLPHAVLEALKLRSQDANYLTRALLALSDPRIGPSDRSVFKDRLLQASIAAEEGSKRSRADAAIMADHSEAAQDVADVDDSQQQQRQQQQRAAAGAQSQQALHDRYMKQLHQAKHTAVLLPEHPRELDRRDAAYQSVFHELLRATAEKLTDSSGADSAALAEHTLPAAVAEFQQQFAAHVQQLRAGVRVQLIEDLAAVPQLLRLSSDGAALHICSPSGKQQSIIAAGSLVCARCMLRPANTFILESAEGAAGPWQAESSADVTCLCLGLMSVASALHSRDAARASHRGQGQELLWQAARLCIAKLTTASTSTASSSSSSRSRRKQLPFVKAVQWVTAQLQQLLTQHSLPSFQLMVQVQSAQLSPTTINSSSRAIEWQS
jgi:hypothetical protein